ncbi:fimbrial chaperone protein [Alkalispirochaeta americana]|uniref:Fimbrial chaperone protein n=1 Tax=Alkalispirochaeta americana TaxID=159291 RepID=A0A1N6WNA7_9SPIO|nr:fimbria/pilus periplasmic chaperone [Alkalispirochaeta americana]SIQ91599.1 fimbrial chaperone protein [Alkalispirochaeta americana]
MGSVARSLRIIALGAMILFPIAPSLRALSLEPLTQVFTTSQAGRLHTYRVTNTQEREIAVQVRMTTRDHNARGKEVREDASDKWVVFPSRMVLAPGQTQAVRVQYTGPGGIEREQAFRIIAEQLPVDISGGDRQSGINVLFRYEGSVYVRPGRFSPDVILAGAERWYQNGSFQGVLVRFENRGATHGILGDLSIHLRLFDGEKMIAEEVFQGAQLPILAGRNLLAGRTLEEVLPLPDLWAKGTFYVDYNVRLID